MSCLLNRLPRVSLPLLAALCLQGLPTATVASAGAAAQVSQTQYTCPMHPHYLSTDPEGRCPLCGMALVPAERGGQGSAEVVVAAEMLQTMGVRIGSARYETLGESLRAFGVVAADEGLETVSVSRIEGWIDGLAVRAEGEAVKGGTLLYSVYSPTLLSAQKDFLNALASGNRSRSDASHQRLRSLGMQEATLGRLRRDRKVIERLPIYAEAAGVVAQLQVRDGEYIEPGTPVLRLQSYERVWVLASIPERDLAGVEAGLTVRVTVPSARATEFASVIDYVYPTIDARTRTGRVRIVVDNVEAGLRPGAYADVVIQRSGVRRLVVPEEAVLRDSRGAQVMVALGEGRFQPRSVRPGISASGLTEILEGLSEEDRVVTSGQFLLDSEARLRRAQADLPRVPAGASLANISLSPAELASFDHLTDAALYLHEALTDGYRIDRAYLAPALAAAKQLTERYKATDLVSVLEGGTAALQQAQEASNPRELRSALAALVQALNPWLEAQAGRHYAAKGLRRFVTEANDRLWLQQSPEPVNPYDDGEGRLQPWPDVR